jgi:hypothetical protein
MTASFTASIRKRVQHVETMPAIPAVFLPLLKLLSGSGGDANVDEVIRLLSYDNTIAPNASGLRPHPCLGWRCHRNPSRLR